MATLGIRSQRIINAVKMALALPAYQIANLIAYVSEKKSFGARLAVAASFLPIVVITTTVWAFYWVIAVRLIWSAIE